jgi:hypothetical protein
MSYGLEQSADRMALAEMYSYYVYASDARDYDDLDNVFLPDTMCDIKCDVP